MTPELWGMLVPAVVALLGAFAAWLRAAAAHRAANGAQASVDALAGNPHGAGGPGPAGRQ